MGYGDDAGIEAGSSKLEARVSSIKERDSLPAGRQGYELRQQ